MEKKEKRKKRLNDKNEDRQVLSLHGSNAAATNEKIVLLRHSSNIETFYEGRKTVWDAHATFYVFIVNHGYLIPNVLELAAYHAPTSTDSNRLYISLPTILRLLNPDDINFRVRSKKEKLFSKGIVLSDEDIYRKCANAMIVHLLLSKIRISMVAKTQTLVKLELLNDSITSDKPDDLIPVDIRPRRYTPQIRRSISSPMKLPSLPNTPRRYLASPPQHASRLGSANSESVGGPLGRISEHDRDSEHSSSISQHDRINIHLPSTQQAAHFGEQPKTLSNSLKKGCPSAPPSSILPISQLPPSSLSPNDILNCSIIESTCAMKIKEAALPPCAVVNPVLALPPILAEKRKARRPSLQPPPTVSQQAAPPSRSQSYHEKTVQALEKEKEKADVHFNWGQARIALPPRRRKKHKLFVQ